MTIAAGIEAFLAEGDIHVPAYIKGFRNRQSTLI